MRNSLYCVLFKTSSSVCMRALAQRTLISLRIVSEFPAITMARACILLSQSTLASVLLLFSPSLCDLDCFRLQR